MADPEFLKGVADPEILQGGAGRKAINVLARRTLSQIHVLGLTVCVSCGKRRLTEINSEANRGEASAPQTPPLLFESATVSMCKTLYCMNISE